MSDTITAIATPMGEGGLSVIRVSGLAALSIASGLFRPAQSVPKKEFIPQRVYFGEILDPDSQTIVDEVLLTYFKAPKSFTAEDVVEISAHGGLFVTTKILQLLKDQGARLAEPGEFTRRAFLNGRIDLSQAEAVTDVIHAASERALRSALAQLKGSLSTQLNDWFERLLAVLAQLEASIDFSEEGLEFQKRETSLQEIQAIQKGIEALIQTYRQGKIFREGAHVVLLGKPNVGKSSLLNALLNEDRAIVTPMPGTTRDTLEERVRIHDIHINLIDAAGLRQNPESIEKEGIKRAKAALDRADLALVIFDASNPLDKNDDLLIQEVTGKPHRVLLNKSDLKEHLDMHALQEKFPDAEFIRVSAKSGTGLTKLCASIYQFVVGDSSLNETLVITRERHRQCLDAANTALIKSCASLEQNLSEEFVAVDIQIAMDRLAIILGKTFEDDLLDQIFGEFCIGK
ncbi:tRNA-5-carboxymethylaminomethyl-2-thiouridine(34)synthesis protein MnmE [hydrothermal vent metagenome]|uniref:tRNA-5-carboxymethylaminomethyl-2-thiouridine(34) synthesis protein MnmE n=1 Tax=hydrothermal vent metagenome TaxID=652676 RepID=A0A3B1CWB9_9ZZZZ